MFEFEQDLVNAFKKNISTLFDIQTYKEEVPFFSRNIDMVMKDDNGYITSIEFKLSNIQKVFEQSLKCLLCSDFVYVCLPNKNLKQQTIDKFESVGIGIILVDNNISILKEAQKSKKNYLKSKIEVYL